MSTDVLGETAFQGLDVLGGGGGVGLFFDTGGGIGRRRVLAAQRALFSRITGQAAALDVAGSMSDRGSEGGGGDGGGTGGEGGGTGDAGGGESGGEP